MLKKIFDKIFDNKNSEIEYKELEFLKSELRNKYKEFNVINSYEFMFYNSVVIGVEHLFKNDNSVKEVSLSSYLQKMEMGDFDSSYVFDEIRFKILANNQKTDDDFLNTKIRLDNFCAVYLKKDNYGILDTKGDVIPYDQKELLKNFNDFFANRIIDKTNRFNIYEEWLNHYLDLRGSSITNLNSYKQKVNQFCQGLNSSNPQSIATPVFRISNGSFQTNFLFNSISDRDQKVTDVDNALRKERKNQNDTHIRKIIDRLFLAKEKSIGNKKFKIELQNLSNDDISRYVIKENRQVIFKGDLFKFDNSPFETEWNINKSDFIKDLKYFAKSDNEDYIDYVLNVRRIEQEKEILGSVVGKIELPASPNIRKRI